MTNSFMNETTPTKLHVFLLLRYITSYYYSVFSSTNGVACPKVQVQYGVPRMHIWPYDAWKPQVNGRLITKIDDHNLRIRKPTGDFYIYATYHTRIFMAPSLTSFHQNGMRNFTYTMNVSLVPSHPLTKPWPLRYRKTTKLFGHGTCDKELGTFNSSKAGWNGEWRSLFGFWKKKTEMPGRVLHQNKRSQSQIHIL